MIMTRDEAAQVVCPFIRQCVNETDACERRDSPIYAHPKCVGSGCAAWRWVEVNVFDADFVAAVKRCAAEIGDTTPNRTKAAQCVAADRAAYGLPTEPTRGYCGAAGVPHELPRLVR